MTEIVGISIQANTENYSVKRPFTWGFSIKQQEILVLNHSLFDNWHRWNNNTTKV